MNAENLPNHFIIRGEMPVNWEFNLSGILHDFVEVEEVRFAALEARVPDGREHYDRSCWCPAHRRNSARMYLMAIYLNVYTPAHRLRALRLKLRTTFPERKGVPIRFTLASDQQAPSGQAFPITGLMRKMKELGSRLYIRQDQPDFKPAA